MPIRYHMNNFSVGANLVFAQGRGANLKFDRRIYGAARSHLCRAGTARQKNVVPENLCAGPQPPV